VTLTVPRQKELKGTNSLADITLTSPLSAFAESVRRIRAAADQSMARTREGRLAARGNVLLVTSAAPNEGKSTTSLALARAYALAGKTVLLVDCDLRKPSLHQHLGQESTAGLIDYLRQADDSVPLGSVVGMDAKSGIGVLLGSRRSSTATDQLLAGPAFGRLVEAAVKAFDVVILDTPPVGPVVDGLYLAQYADALIFVVRWATTSQAEVRSALRTLSDAKRENAEIIAVLAQSARKADAYYGRYYGYYTEPSGA
jgi:capsular exopolysaccharide synthesis family protein